MRQLTTAVVVLILNAAAFYEPSVDAPADEPKDVIIVKADELVGYITNQCQWATYHDIPELTVSKELFLDPFTDNSLSDLERQKAYIKSFAAEAQDQQQRHKIPASITLAQGILESNAGSSELALKNRNHFGIKCFSRSCKPGHCSNYTDDSHKDFFRIFATVQDSYEAHSHLIRPQRDRYRPCYDCSNYKEWARCLQKAGYATDRKYAKKLIKLIETHKLYQYD